jgi:amidohydrolase
MPGTSIDELKARVCAAIDRRRDDIVRVGRTIFERPEVGYKEFETAALVADELRKLRIAPEEGLAVTGIRGDLPMGASGPTVAVLGELDALPVPDHPQADPRTGAAHACGHNTQIAHMLGVAMALQDADVAGELAGRVSFVAVPAEEYVELEWRREQMASGRFEFLGGKPEMLSRGYLDGIDMGMMIHASTGLGDVRLAVSPTSNGMVAKTIRYVGRAAHAASAPHRGINALSAATLALAAINFNRETFQEEDVVRIHPIITKGGDVVNVVPAEVKIETFVRSMTVDGLRDAEMKVDRCLRAGAMAIGATVEIETLPGYLPLIQNGQMKRLFQENAHALVGADGFADSPPIKASTDAGDLSHVMPILHPSAGGFHGTMHGADFQIVDDEYAYVVPVKSMAMTVIDLLANDAANARQVVADFKPKLSRDEYLTFMRDLNKSETYKAG